VINAIATAGKAEMTVVLTTEDRDQTIGVQGRKAALDRGEITEDRDQTIEAQGRKADQDQGEITEHRDQIIEVQGLKAALDQGVTTGDRDPIIGVQDRIRVQRIETMVIRQKANNWLS
jgi:hypothetical protein